MYGVKISNDIGFIVNCRCCVGEIASSYWNIKMNRFPKDFKELYNIKNIKVLYNPEEIETKRIYTIYKDPFIRMVDNFALFTTSKWCKNLQIMLSNHYNFSNNSTFDDFINVIKGELNRKFTEGHFIPIYKILERYRIDYIINYTDIKNFFDSNNIKYNNFDYNECDKLDYNNYLEYKDEIYSLYEKDVLILENYKDIIWHPK